MPPDLQAILSTAAAQDLIALRGTGELLFSLSVEHLGRTARAEGDTPKPPSSVAILPMAGALTPRGSSGMEGFRNRLASAVGNSDVGAIVLDVNSPGGTVAGTAETADAVRRAAAQKPVIALADSLMASAAYWSCSGATQIWVTPSASVGSIGIMGMHLDVSKALETMGVTPTVITSTDSPFKAELSPFAPLSDDAKANVQAQADEEHGNFIRDVATGRKLNADKVRSDFGQGRTVSAQEAVRRGMADRVGTMADVLASLRTQAGGVRRRFSAAAFD
jgi:capsid assembly protease